MKLLLHSRFYPSIGGIETVADLLAREWVNLGITVTIVTDVPRPSQKNNFPFSIYYRPQPLAFLDLLRKHDVFVHFNIRLRAIWPLFAVRRPFIATHHGFYVIDESGHRDWREKLKLFIAKRATENIAVSHSIAQTIGIPCKVIPNPFSAEAFSNLGTDAKTRDLVFVGRLVSSKGVDVLIRGVSLLKDAGLKPTVTIIGDGPEREPLEKLAREVGVENQISFTGTIPTATVTKLLSQHKVMVVPSIWNEGFGVVALEGIASGCVVVGSDSGGLPEAVGDCGIVVRAGDPQKLADGIKRILTEPGLIDALRINSADHLARHHPARVAQRYLTVITQAISE